MNVIEQIQVASALAGPGGGFTLEPRTGPRDRGGRVEIVARAYRNALPRLNGDTGAAPWAGGRVIDARSLVVPKITVGSPTLANVGGSTVRPRA